MDYTANPLSLEQILATDGLLLLDFGTNWCGWCGRARYAVDAALAGRSDVRHVRVEDGPGRRLGRHFGVRLWPTLVLLRDGVELARAVRPADRAEVEALLAGVASAP
ncbi:MAG: thioredoxin family protein [Rhodocyclaceae bacterium]|nr:thioredoxin family protein [Rhodocyclaceae bacterium]